jgi:hypothetical protein
MNTQQVIKQDKVKTEIIVANLEKKHSKTFKALATVKAIRNQEEFDYAAECVSVLKDAAKIAKVEERKITDPLTDALDATRDLFRPFYSKVNEAETTIKLLMSVYMEDNKKKIAILEEKVANGEIKNISTFVKKVGALTIENNAASIRKVWKAILTNEKVIPRQFLMPDTAKIVAHLKAGGAPIPGVEWKQVESIAI